MPRPLLFVVNVDWFFLSHRLPLAEEAKKRNIPVAVAAGDTGAAQRIRRQGIDFFPLPLSRSGRHPLQEVRTFWGLVALYRRLRPRLVHHVTAKPIIYGSIAARIGKVPAVVNAITGLGFSFTQRESRGLQNALSLGYRIALRGPRSRTIFQNPNDMEYFIQRGLATPEDTVLILGSGVDCARFRPGPEPEDLVVILPARMLWHKGIAEFVEAADRIRQRGLGARFVLVGKEDPENPAAVPPSWIREKTRTGAVEWWGHKRDMPHVYRRSAIVVLPSYREGLPKVLLEAAASGLPIVATDVPGCREAVRHGETGYLVPVRDSRALAEAIEVLLRRKELRQRFGTAARKRTKEKFSIDRIVAQTFQVYEGLLPGQL